MFSFILAIGFSEMSHASCVDDLINEIKRSPNLSTEQIILQAIEKFPHGSLLVAKEYSEEQLKTNWAHLLNFLTRMGLENFDYKVELESQQTSKIDELDNLSFHTMPSIFPSQHENSAYKVAIAQVFHLSEDRSLSEEKMVSIKSLLKKYENLK